MSKDDFRARVRADLIKNKVIVERNVSASFSNELLCDLTQDLKMSNVIKLPITTADKWRKEMAASLRYYADLIENDEAEPQIEMFMIALKQDKEFAIGGCGQITRLEQRSLWTEFKEFLHKLNT